MKTILIALMLFNFLPLGLAGQGEGLYYTSGPKDVVGTKLTDSSFLNIYEVCFKGKASKVKATLWKFMDDDIEKAKPFTRVDTKNKVIVYGFVDTKCLDEGESEEDCKIVDKIKKCK